MYVFCEKQKHPLRPPLDPPMQSNTRILYFMKYHFHEMKDPPGLLIEVPMTNRSYVGHM